MKRLTMLITVLCLGTLILSGCDDEDKSKGATLQSKKVNLLVAVEGRVEIKREGWKEYVPVAFGTLVRSTDLLNAEGNATLLCADLNLKAATGKGRQPCPTEAGWLEYEGSRFDSGQRGSGPSVPYILYPRNTLVLESRPLLRWNDTGASSYTVSIERDGKEIWSQSDVVGNTIRYPDDEPALQPGADYSLTVQENTTGGHSSTEDKAKGLNFRLLRSSEAALVEERRDEIMALELPDESVRHLVLAVYYAGLELENERRLWGDAWLLFESVDQTQRAPAVQLLLGDVCVAIKLPDEANAAYQAALESAKALGDLESQAAAYAGLWRVWGYAEYLEQALELYERLGDEDAAEALRE